MDSSNADGALFRESSARMNKALNDVTRERDEALQALAESRARFADSEARRAELEAVRDRVLKMAAEDDAGAWDAHQELIRQVLAASPFVVLEDRDREVAARAVESVAHDLAEPRVLWWGTYGPQVQTDEAHGTKVSLDEWFAERATAIRKGDA